MLSGSDYGAHLLNQLLPSMLKQFRFGELILWANFPGEEIHYRDGYLTDVSEFCIRIHPFNMRYGEGSV